MPESVHMEIGGVNLKLTDNTSCSFQVLNRGYRSFCARRNTGAEGIDIEVCPGSKYTLNPDRSAKIFDSGQSWSMFRNNDDYFIKFESPSLRQPLWLAKMRGDVTKVTVYCSEKLVSKRNGKTVVSNPVCYPLDQILLMYYLAKRKGALFHAAGISIRGKGYMFPGKFGAGKSTIIRQFAAREHIGFLSDDRVVVREIDGSLMAFGTPWPGEEGIAENTSVPLSGIFFIAHASANGIREISRQEALERILPVTSVPWYDREVMPDVLLFCEQLISHVPTHELHFKPGVEVVDVFEDFVSI